MLCGPSALPWENFRDAVICLSLKVTPLEEIPGIVGEVDRPFYIARTSIDLMFATVMQWTKDAACSDQRDKIYAILNLVHSGEGITSLIPDYFKTPLQVFQDVVFHYLKAEQDLGILACCELQNDAITYPSWVPDWSKRRVCDEIRTAAACWLSPADAQYLGDGRLQATGLYYSSIRHLESPTPLSNGRDVPDIYPAMMRIIRKVGSCITPEKE